jgi:Protein of unknown function (DUF2587)
MDDQTNHDQASAQADEHPRVVVVGPDGVAVETDAAHSRERPVTEMIEQPAKVMRVGNMVRQELEDGLAPELVEELDRLSLPFAEDSIPSEGELRVAQAQLVGWLEGLFHGIQTTLFAQQMAARAQLEQMRRALPPGMMPASPEDGQQLPPTSGPYL